MLSRKSKWRFRTNPSLVMSFYSLVIKKRESIKKQPRRVKKKVFSRWTTFTISNWKVNYQLVNWNQYVDEKIKCKLYPWDRSPVSLHNVIPSINHTLVSLLNIKWTFNQKCLRYFVKDKTASSIQFPSSPPKF